MNSAGTCDGDAPPPELLSENRPVDLAPFEPAPSNVVIRPLSQEEGMRRIEERRQAFMARLRGQSGPSEDAAALRERQERARAEADVVEAARRSQAEIRRHVDAYLKEALEPLISDLAQVVIERVTERVAKGFAGASEAQAIALDRMSSDLRTMFRAFARSAAKGTTAKTSSPAPRAARKGARRGKAR